MKTFKFLIPFFFSLFSCSLAVGQTVVTCGASKGKIYILENGKGEWADDGITDGGIALMVRQDKKWDIVTNSRRGSVSALSDGATVTLSHANDRVVTVVVSYPLQTVETYQFNIDAKNRKRGIVLWTATRNNSIGITMKAMHAECNFEYEVQK